MAKPSIHIKAPVRIDLSGGTIDLWPLYLLFKNARTINIGINLFAEAQAEPIKEDEITLKSIDQGKEITIYPNDLYSDRLDVPPSLIIHYRLLQYFHRSYPEMPFSLKLTSIAKSPAGAGLGGSSSLNIALTSALYCWVHQKQAIDIEADGRTIIEIARDVEAGILNGPAGLQDYFGALYGGLQEITWLPHWHVSKQLDRDRAEEISNRLLLFYSGQSRNSGINNWEVYQSVLNQERKMVNRFENIIQATDDLSQALDKKNWKKVGEAIEKEWHFRKQLSKGITTSKIEKAFQKAKELGASAAKICGAGGGGCFFIYFEENNPELKEKVAESLKALELEHLPFEMAKCGLKES